MQPPAPLDQPFDDAPDLEALTRLAVLVTGAAASAIGFVDAERASVVAATGCPRVDLPRSHALCAVTVAADAVIAVADAAADPRFAGKPEVAGPGGARMYVGVPVRTVDGHPVGALQVVDSSPGELTPGQLDALQDLAAQAERLLELRRVRAELAEMTAEAGQLAGHDLLTGLANGRLLTERLEHAVARAERTGRWPVVCFCDIDRFAELNQRHGSAVGDAVLVAVGDRLRAGVRALDTVARVGGDEFAVLCEDTMVDDVDVVRERLLAGLDLLRVEGLDEAVAVSVGAVRALPGATAGGLIREATRRMHQQRALGVPSQAR
jgi:diguanylate cyclase (GGDEF)-like protein